VPLRPRFFGALFLIDEAPNRLDLAEMKRTFRGLLAAFKLRDLWVIGLFLFYIISIQGSARRFITT
jgi:hypothetical protein